MKKLLQKNLPYQLAQNLKTLTTIVSLNRFLLMLSIALISFSANAQGGKWLAVATPCPAGGGGAMLLLSDGSAMVKTNGGGTDGIGNTWYRLIPNDKGSYINGTWQKVKSMHNTRLYFSTQMLMDGRVYCAGGEYGTGGSAAEVYDPVTDAWTDAPAPGGFISDANSAILDNGHLIQAMVNGTLRGTKNYNPATNTYATGATCIGIHNESVWLKLPDNSILFVDRGSLHSERYIPSLDLWKADADVPVALYDPWGLETGGAALLPDGRAFFSGSLANTAYYTPSGDTSKGTWTAGPNIAGKGQPDGPLSMMPNGIILMAVSPVPNSGNHFPSPTSFYEFNYLTNTYDQIKAPGGGTTISAPSYVSSFLNLPDGSILYSQQGSTTYYVYQPKGAVVESGKPKIKKVSLDGSGLFYNISGKLFNGISEGSTYGDDFQMASNYPIVRLTDSVNNKVFYCRTYDWNATGVMRTKKDKAKFTLPAGLPTGSYSLQVIANGIPSDDYSFAFTSPASETKIITKAENNSLKIYPNPAVDKTTFQFSVAKDQHVSIRIYDAKGKEVKVVADQTMAKGDHTIQLNTTNMQKGMYFVKMISANGTTNLKLIVQ